MRVRAHEREGYGQRWQERKNVCAKAREEGKRMGGKRAREREGGREGGVKRGKGGTGSKRLREGSRQVALNVGGEESGMKGGENLAGEWVFAHSKAGLSLCHMSGIAPGIVLVEILCLCQILQILRTRQSTGRRGIRKA